MQKRPELYFEKQQGSVFLNNGNGYQGNSGNSIFGGPSQGGIFGQNNQGNNANPLSWMQKTGQIGQNQPSAFNNPAGQGSSFFNNQQTGQGGQGINLFNSQNPNQSNIFNQQQPNQLPFAQQQQVLPYNPQVIEGMKGALM